MGNVDRVLSYKANVAGNTFNLWGECPYRPSGMITDGTDGSSHTEAIERLLQDNPEKRALTFLLCTDSVQIHKSNQKSAWPVFLVCDQIPRKLR